MPKYKHLVINRTKHGLFHIGNGNEVFFTFIFCFEMMLSKTTASISRFSKPTRIFNQSICNKLEAFESNNACLQAKMAISSNFASIYA